MLKKIPTILLLIALYIFIVLMTPGCRARKEKSTIDLHQVSTSHKLAVADSAKLKTSLIINTIKEEKKTGKHTYDKTTTTEFDPTTGKPTKQSVHETGTILNDMNSALNINTSFDQDLTKGSKMESSSDSTNTDLHAKKKIKLSGNTYLQIIGIIAILLAAVFIWLQVTKLLPNRIIKSHVIDKQLLA